MNKKIDLKNRKVDIYDVDTGLYEEEIISFLKRQMKVVIHSARFSNKKYVFTGDPKDSIGNAIVITGYRKKYPGEKTSVDIG
jgi:hypothetical protein